MTNKNPIAGIYARKSLFTGKGESVQNQISMGMEYARSKSWDTQVYTDEGYSGSSTDRPGFRQMLLDIESGKIQHVIFYRLDRISRRILDLCEFIEQLDGKNVGFISLTENFDTNTPLGRAMVHIAATFAQLEREMLAQRVKDNMIQLAKTGRWLGGVTPTGYKSKRIEYITEDLKKKSMYVLQPIPKELELVRLLYDKYLELRSLYGVEKYCMMHNIQSKNRKDFHKMTVRAILSNPVYIKADQQAYNYFQAHGIQIAGPIEEFNGKKGILAYNKNIEKKGKSNQLRDPSHWVLAIGNHQGIIDSDKWIEVQALLQQNKIKAPRTGTSAAALLSGILRCGKCGSFIKVKYGQKKNATGKRLSYYVCHNKEISTSTRCDNTNVRTDLLEGLVEDTLLDIPSRQDYIFSALQKQESGKVSLQEKHHKINELKAQINETERKINNLLDQLEDEEKASRTARHIKKRIHDLEKDMEAAEKKLISAVKSSADIHTDHVNLGLFRHALTDLSVLYHQSEDIALKRNFIASLVNSIRWHDGKIDIDVTGFKKLE